jgi:hypothetical protein
VAPKAALDELEDMDKLVNYVLEVDIDGQKDAADWPPATLTIPEAKKACRDVWDQARSGGDLKIRG